MNRIVFVEQLFVFRQASAPHLRGKRAPKALGVQAALLNEHAFHTGIQGADEVLRLIAARLGECGDIVEVVLQERIHINRQKRAVQVEEHGFVTAFRHCGQSFLKGARK